MDIQMTSETGKTIKAIIKEGLGEQLRLDGYHRQGNTWYQRGDGWIRVVNVQASQSNMGTKGKFTVNLGVYFDKVADVLGHPNDKFPKEFECHLRIRIGLLLPEHRDKWWEFDENTDLAIIASELRQAWSKYGKVWLEKYCSLEAARAYEVEHKNDWQAIQMSVALGDIKAAKELLDAALVERSNKDNRYIVDWAAKHGLSPQSKSE
jgi:hypothetical protein